MCQNFISSSYNCTSTNCTNEYLSFPINYYNTLQTNSINFLLPYNNISIDACSSGYELIGYFCHKCPSDFVAVPNNFNSSLPPSISCIACPAFTTPNFNQSDCICPISTVAVPSSIFKTSSTYPVAFSCFNCVNGMNCSVADTDIADVSLYSGFWRAEYSSKSVYQCGVSEACLGGPRVGEESCNLGYHGALCAACEVGYYLSYFFIYFIHFMLVNLHV